MHRAKRAPASADGLFELADATGPPKRPKYSSWIVGLYEGGLVHDCDIYHPTGVCLMRAKTFVAGASERSYQFCPVC